MLHRHATDVVSLVAGTIFAGLTAVWLLNVSDVLDLEAAWLAGPLILILAGVVGLVAALRPSGSKLRPEESAPAPANHTAERVRDDSAGQALHDDEPTTALDDE